MKLADLKEQIQDQALAPLYLLTGDESALISRAQRLFGQIIPAEDREMNEGRYDFASQGLAPILADMKSPAFFGDHRLTIVANPSFLAASGPKVSEADEAAFISLLERPVAGNVTVLLAPGMNLDKRKKLTKTVLATAEQLDLKALNEQQTKAALQQLLDQRGYRIEPVAAEELLVRTQASYSQLLVELPKLLAYAQDSRLIEREAVAQLVPRESTAKAFDMADLLLKGQTAAAMTLYHDLIKNGEAPLRLIALLLGHFRLLLQVAGMTGPEKQLAQQLKVHPYRVKLARQSLQFYALGRLRTGFLSIVDMERKLKSQRVDADELFESFILTFTLPQEA
ncbi:DNA polymerase III subunit delta [Leuconostocaceae bacterium ESL0958]|nr:DNA polymerase III subunit delta [Leuconostocaceae bacterium ESL0958]